MRKRLLVVAAVLAACGGAVGPLSNTTAVLDDGGAGPPAGTSSSATGEPTPIDATAPSCSPVGGPYERGKSGGDPECCTGLTEVDVLSAATLEDGGPTCAQEPLAVFICLEGTCGDGICERPENQPCTCPQDCGGSAPDGG